MNYEIYSLSNSFNKKSEIIRGEFLPQAEDLLKKWEVKYKPAAELVKFFKANTKPESWEVFENKPFQTFRVAGFTFKEIDSHPLLFSIKEWHPQDQRIPTTDCFLTFSIYKGKEYYNSWNIPDFRLQVNHNSKEIITCSYSLLVNRNEIGTELDCYLKEVENFFEGLNKNYLSLI